MSDLWTSSTGVFIQGSVLGVLCSQVNRAHGGMSLDSSRGTAPSERSKAMRPHPLLPPTLPLLCSIDRQAFGSGNKKLAGIWLQVLKDSCRLLHEDLVLSLATLCWAPPSIHQWLPVRLVAPRCFPPPTTSSSPLVIFIPTVGVWTPRFHGQSCSGLLWW